MTRWVIVGGGTAGCVLADRLTEEPRNHVTLVEAGGDRPGPPPASFLDDLARPGASFEGLVVTDGGPESRPYPQGRGLGGSSAVNGGLLQGVDAALAGTKLVRERVPDAELGAVDRALLGAAPDAVAATLSRHAGVRQSTADRYLRGALGRPNLDVVSGRTVARVELAGRRATGIVTAAGDRIAGDRIVVSCGAIHSPALLLRSGVDTPGVGRRLADHACRVLELRLAGAVNPDPAALVIGSVLRRGLTEIVSMNHVGRGAPGAAALIAGVLRSSRRGSVRLDPERADDPAASPVVDFASLTAGDCARLGEAVALAESLLGTSPFAEIVADVTVASGLGGYARATSTCAMGTVVDADGAVAGYEGLFVADASVLASPPESGPYLPVVQLAERLAARWRRST